MKIWWAKRIVELQPRLLKGTCETELNGRTVTVTPLQYMFVQKALHRGKQKNLKEESKDEDGLESELRALEDFLKLQCIRSFDNRTRNDIMYTRENGQAPFQHVTGC